MSLKENIRLVEERICKASLSINKDPKGISLIAVTKNVPQHRILEALDFGITHIGENRADELVNKYGNIDKNIDWHLIGSLQTNKVKDIIDRVELIHSLDRISLVKEIDKRAGRINKKVKALVQVNISKEKTKSGIFEEDLLDFLKEIAHYPHVDIKGLMTIAPLTEDDHIIRACFRQLRYHFEDLRDREIPHINMEYLSMGMSNDYEIAIEEGSNMVRIGRAIFEHK